MKQFITILLSVFYLALIAGLPVKLHYCKGDLVSVEFLNTSEECCCVEAKAQACCSEESDDRSCQVALEDECCSFEHFFIQYDRDNQVSKVVNVSSDYGKDQPVYHSVVYTNAKHDADSDEQWYLTHPPPIPQPLWLLHCSFTFYG